MSSAIPPRFWRTAYSSSPKSSPTGPTTRTSVKKLAASEKCTAEPPSIRSRSPNGVLTASKAIDPTTTRLIDARRLAERPGPPLEARANRLPAHAGSADRGVRRAGGAPGRRRPQAGAAGRPGADQGRGGWDELRRHPPARELLSR